VVTDGKNNFTSYGLREEMKVALVWSDKKRAIKAMQRLEKWKEKYKDLLEQGKDFNENSIANIDNQ
jgi:sulfur transfer protein SufE